MNENKQNEKIVFTKDMTLVEVLNINENARNILMGFGMHCFGCPLSQMETLEEASYVHGIELEYLLFKLNELNDDDYFANANSLTQTNQSSSGVQFADEFDEW